MTKITIEIPETLTEKEVIEWVQIKVERHLREVKALEVPDIETLIKPDMDLFKIANKLTVDIIEKPTDEVIKQLDDTDTSINKIL